MAYENLPFVDALKHLAKQAGVELAPPTPQAQEAFAKSKIWQKAMNVAGHYFREKFLSDQGQAARQYMEQRGFTQDTLDFYKIGYAPETWDGLIQHAKSHGIDLDTLHQVGLVKLKDPQQGFDFFRNRIMFPVRNAQGKVVAYGGRVLDNSEPKYLNSPETQLFNKSQTLFNYHHAKELQREFKHFIMMEGYTDVMMAQQFNLGPCVATLGTAMTEDHVRLLKRHDLPLYLVYDADQAGQRAMERSLPFFLKYGIETKALTLPEKMDPADFLLSQSDYAEQWQQLLKNSPDIFTFKLERLIAEKGESIDAKVTISQELCHDLQSCRDPVRTDAYLRLLAKRLDSDIDALKKKLNLLQAPTQSISQANLQSKLPSSNINRDAIFHLLAICLVEYGYTTEIEENPNLYLPDTENAVVLKKWIDFGASGNFESSPSHDEFRAGLKTNETEIFNAANGLFHKLEIEKADYEGFFKENLSKLIEISQALKSNTESLQKARENQQQDRVELFLAQQKQLLKG
jgi:DNA primase catalytic core